jgi:cobalt-zinc-cadmium resistance protein CzcA
VLSSFLFAKGAKEWHNPIMAWLTDRYRRAVTWAIEHRYVTVGGAVFALCLTAFLAFSGVIGSEFLPHLDEGAIWVRGTLAPSTGPTEGIDVMNKARVVLAAFPEVTKVVSQVGRPDDGTDTTGFFNTEYFVDLKPKDQWRPVFGQNKEELIGAMDRELEKMPGVIWNFSQPISDNVEEAVSGVKGELAVKLYGEDLRTLEATANKVQDVMSRVPGVADLGLFRVIGQPNLTYTVDRPAAARYGINVSDVQDAIQTAVGGGAVSQVLKGEARYDLVVRYQKPYRDTPEAINDIRLLSPSGERVSLAQVTKVKTEDGAEEIYREAGQRYVAIKYSVRGRDLGSTVEEAIQKVNAEVKLPPGYKFDWAGEYESQKRSSKRLALVLPITILIIFVILYTMFSSAADSGQRGDGAPGRHAGALVDGHQLQRLVGCGFSGALRRFGADRRDHARIHQPAAGARPFDRGISGRGCGVEASSDHDDDARGDAWVVACGDLAWHRLRFAAAFRDCYCRRTAGGAKHQRLPAADPVCLDRGRGRCAADAGNGV